MSDVQLCVPADAAASRLFPRFARLPEHIAQRAYADVAGVSFDNPAVMWRGLMTTQGVFDAVWVNRATGEQVRRHPQRVGLTWFAFQPIEPSARQPGLELAVPGGVRRADPPK